MRLDEFLRQNDLGLNEFARRIGVDPATVHRIKNGTVTPHRRTGVGYVSAAPGYLRQRKINGFDQWPGGFHPVAGPRRNADQALQIRCLQRAGLHPPGVPPHCGGIWTA